MFGDSSSSVGQLLNGESTSGHSENVRVTDEPMPRNAVQSFTLKWLPTRVYLNPARIIAGEFLGTFILIFSICGILGSMEMLGSQGGLIEYAATAGAAIAVVVFSLGGISGAHVNPAVTIAFAVFGHFSWSKVPFYVSAQLLGSILATYFGELVYGVKPLLMITQPIKGGVAEAFWAELIATFFVTFLAASLARDVKSVGHLAGLVMGIAIALAVLITGPISGGSLNPARSFGPAILARNFDHIWIYLLGPVAGAVLGVLMVHVLCLEQQPPQNPPLNLPTTTANSLR